MDRPQAITTRTSGCAATPTAGSRTARTARRSPEPRAPATRSRPTTSGGGSASRSPRRTAPARQPRRRTRPRRSHSRRRPGRREHRRAVDHRHVRSRAVPERECRHWAGRRRSPSTYQWLRCPADGGLARRLQLRVHLGRRRRSSYTLVAEDVGQRLRIRVTASNSLGTQTVASNATAAVQSSTTTTTQQRPANTSCRRSFGLRERRRNACRRASASGPARRRFTTRTSGCAASRWGLDRSRLHGDHAARRARSTCRRAPTRTAPPGPGDRPQHARHGICHVERDRVGASRRVGPHADHADHAAGRRPHLPSGSRSGFRTGPTRSR